MDRTDAIDQDLTALLIQLCTRIGMITEDMNPLALNVSGERLNVRVAEIAHAVRTLAALARAAETLMAA